MLGKSRFRNCRHELAGRTADRHHQIRLPIVPALFQVLGHRFLHLRLRMARHVERDFVQIDAIPHLPNELRLESS